MIFNSVTFLLLLTVSVALYWVLPLRPRLWMLFIASLMFYGFWRVDFVSLMLLSSGVDYVAALGIARARDDERRRKLWLISSLAINFGLLFVFKYAGFALDNAANLLSLFGFEWHPKLDIILPLGISFYTFQSVSYTIDVYRREREAERDYLMFACFVTYFPQLVAGPILRASELLDQLGTRSKWRADEMVLGLRRILFGLFLKVGLADNIAEQVDIGFAQDIAFLHALDVWTLAFLFGFQIYFDFAGYSQIAIGSAHLMGIRFPENFNFPYLATSPREFWQRWHISLSSWIRDYLYVPLSRTLGASAGAAQLGHSSEKGLSTAPTSSARDVRPLLLTWIIMGFWHGAAWTFVLWGAYHGLLVLAHRAIRGRKLVPDTPLGSVLGWCATLPLIMLGWIPFRAQSLEVTLTMWSRVLDPRQYLALGLRENSYLSAATVLLLITVAGLVSGRVARWAERPISLPVLAAGYAVVIGVVVVLLRPISQFIYFQF